MKGLSPIIATILLVIIAVAVAAMVVNWQSLFLPQYAAGLANESRTQLQCMRAGMSVESVTYDCNNDCSEGVNHILTLNVRNIGDISLPVNSVYLVNNIGETFSFATGRTVDMDQNVQIVNISSSGCAGINKSVSAVYISTACRDMPPRLDGNIIAWINC
jgi:flagellin-like protein